MSVVLKDTNKKYIMDWNTTSQSIDVLSFGYTQSGVTYSLKYENTYKLYSGITPEDVQKAYGSWYDTTTQTPAFFGIPVDMFCNSTAFESGITKLANNRDFQVQYDGTYNIQFSVQLDQNSGSAHFITIWFRKNGVDIPWSASTVAIQGTTAEAIPSWNFITDMNAGDYLSIPYIVSNTQVVLRAANPQTFYPGIPSVIVTMWKI